MKKKVKRLLCVCCFILCLISLFACGTAADDSMVGRWETVIEDEELGSVMMVYHFKDDGTIYLEQNQQDKIPFSIPFGSYFVAGDTITIESDGVEKCFTFSVSENQLTLNSDEDGDLIFYKISY